MNNSIKIIHWTPRIICIIAILFISLFALDSFGPDLTIWQQLKGFIIHLIPSFLLIIFLLFAWKKELYGGIIFIIIGIALTPLVYKNNYKMNESVGMSLGIIAVITIPFIAVGILFVISHFLKKKHHAKNYKSNLD